MPHRGIINGASLVTYNAQQSQLYVAERPARELYKKRHRTMFLVFKCSDGRLNVSVFTKTPMGIFYPFRNIGGDFRLGWKPLNLIIGEMRKRADAKDRDCAALCTYHFSKGERRRGCKGHGYDKDKAFASSLFFKEELAGYGKRVKSRNGFYSILVGIETDEEALIIHGEDGVGVHIDGFSNITVGAIRDLLASMFPSIEARSPNVLDDLVPLIVGNIEHVSEVRASRRPVAEADHRESVVILGRGADWLHLPNVAMIVGPWQNRLAQPFGTAMNVVKFNLIDEKIPGDKIVVMSSTPYYDPDQGDDYLAERLSWEMHGLAKEVIDREFPELVPQIEFMVTIVDQKTRLMRVLNDG